MCQPHSQDLSSLPPSMRREAEKRDPGNEVGYVYLTLLRVPRSIEVFIISPYRPPYTCFTASHENF